MSATSTLSVAFCTFKAGFSFQQPLIREDAVDKPILFLRSGRLHVFATSGVIKPIDLAHVRWCGSQ